MATNKENPTDQGENRLAAEQSPYLLQHARNPVDWYPWGEEAFEKAGREDKPIFLSIGYATCHWCHVMAHESFEDPEVAALMNRAFVNIKVDREERPDVDKIYMAVCQAMTGGGGWPLTVLLTPELKPFFTATYIPRESRPGMVGMKALIPRIERVWREERKVVETSSEKIVRLLADLHDNPGDPPGEEILEAAFAQLSELYDPDHGGFGRAPKFPVPHNLVFLLRYGERTGRKDALEMVEKTLRHIRMGGITDHVGFGIHRYATDTQWLVPHFEKMLYDQALLANATLEVYQKTGDASYAEMAEEIFTYVTGDMTSADGGFYSAEDADSEGEEGKFYLWRLEELQGALSAAEAEFVARHFGATAAGNYADGVSGRATGNNILHLTAPLVDSGVEAVRRWRAIRPKLHRRREKRVRPLTDDKILTDWNGLMIAALAKGGRILGDPGRTEAAARAADFIFNHLQAADGGLLHRFRQGAADIPGFLDDYAFLVWGLLELYRSTFDLDHLARAIALSDHLVENFWDSRAGGFFFTASAAERLILRQKEAHDGALPSGNAVMLWNLNRLFRKTGDPKWGERAETLAAAFSERIRRSPAAHTQWMAGLEFLRAPSREVVVVGEPDDPSTASMVRALNGMYSPHTVVLLKTRENKDRLAQLVPFTRFHERKEGKTTVYVCENFSCRLPLTSVKEVTATLVRGGKRTET